MSLADDEMLLVISHLTADRDLASLACTSRKFPSIVLVERERLRAEKARAIALEKIKHRAIKQRFASLEGDERLLRTVLGFMLLNAPKSYSIEVDAKGRKQLVPPASGVCRLRIGICRGAGGCGGVTFDERKADHMVDVLAIQDHSIRKVEFRGAPLGATGAAVAMRQAKAPQLSVPADTPFYGKVFRIFIRASFAEVTDPTRRT